MYIKRVYWIIKGRFNLKSKNESIVVEKIFAVSNLNKEEEKTSN